MDYATTHHKRGRHPRRKTTAIPIQKARGIYRFHATPERRSSSTKGHPTACPGGGAADGFVRAVFPATLKENKTLRDSTEKRRLADDFCTSFVQLTAYYGISLPLPQPFCYPDTITHLLPVLQDTLKQNVEGFYGLRFVQGHTTAFLVSEERHSTGQSLYYVPVLPLFKMLQDKHHKKAAALLLSVGAWLYRIVNIPYYRQEDAYLYYQYDMIKDWVEQDTDEEYDSTERHDLEAAATIGDRMEKKLRHPANLEWFARRLGRLRAYDELDGECHAVATIAHSLFTQYPNESVFRNAPIREETQDNDAYYDNEVITMDKYISFSADTEGWLFDTVADTVNNDFNECGETEEPQLQKCFDGNPITGSFDFERRVFDLMDRLCDILYNYKMQ